MQPDHTMPLAWPETACRNGRPRDAFRGPRRDPSGRFVACLGGTETFGKFVDRPWPDGLEARLGLPCHNLGIANASVEALLRENAVLDGCRTAAATVIEVTGALNLSNRLYSVHPRRNDRFLRPTKALEALYPEVDFADFCFTRHLVRELHALSPDRFAVVRAELQQVWAARMRMLIGRCGGPVWLLWFAQSEPGPGSVADLGSDPLFVTGQMMARLSPFVAGTVVSMPSSRALVEGARSQHPGRPFGRLAHQEAADNVAAAVRRALREPQPTSAVS